MLIYALSSDCAMRNTYMKEGRERERKKKNGFCHKQHSPVHQKRDEIELCIHHLSHLSEQ